MGDVGDDVRLDDVPGRDPIRKRDGTDVPVTGLRAGAADVAEHIVEGVVLLVDDHHMLDR